MTIDWNSSLQYSGFPAAKSVTSFSPSKLQKGAFSGIDFATGARVDLSNYYKSPETVFSPENTGSPGAPQDATSALPNLDPKVKSWLDLYKATSPQRLAEMEAAANVSANLSERQLRQLYPYLSAAGAEATARSLAASQAYRAFTEQLPSNVQNIMASKQAQATSAAGAEAERQRATAAQQDAASRYPGRFAGQYIQVG
jgi:hypothetical protein